MDSLQKRLEVTEFLMQLIPIENILYMMIPLIVVGYFYFLWLDDAKEILYATLRMVVQLLLIGYVLVYLFETNSWMVGGLVLSVMIIMSSFIILRNIENKTKYSYMIILFSIAFGGTATLFLVIKFVLELTSFYEPKYTIPLAGMIYANSMNAISLVAERFEKELKTTTFEKAKQISFKASMIPIINSFLAVGVVSLPGMMSGQILSGVDPLIAVRYQIVVMAMVLGSAGISVVVYLSLMKILVHLSRK